MLVKRKDCEFFVNTIDKLKDKKFNIQTQYKILKLKKSMQEELDLTQDIILKVCDEFWEKDEEGNIITTPEGAVKFKIEKEPELQQKLKEIDNTEIQVPDVYFSLDELEGLELTLEELQIFMAFIK